MTAAVITGGCGALGFATAKRLAANGVDIVLVDLDEAAAHSKAEELRRQTGVAAFGLVLDITTPEAPDAMAEFVAKQAGRLDILVNNAGLSKGGQLATVTLADWNAVVAINLTAPMLLSQAALRFWRDGAGGRVVNIGSRTWVSGSGPAYTSTKAGLVGLTRSMAVQLGPLGVTVNAVAPSYIDTAFNGLVDDETRVRTNEAHQRLGVLSRLGRPEDIANAVAFLASPEASFITGEVLHVCGGAQLAGRPSMFAL